MDRSQAVLVLSCMYYGYSSTILYVLWITGGVSHSASYSARIVNHSLRSIKWYKSQC
jgi:hypothetical protein